LIKYQKALIKVKLYPSGPGFLLPSLNFTTSSISSNENVSSNIWFSTSEMELNTIPSNFGLIQDEEEK
jgi:hypothetical protein